MKRRGFLATVAVVVTAVGLGAVGIVSAEAATGAITGYGRSRPAVWRRWSGLV